jgi:hypothetical protein
MTTPFESGVEEGSPGVLLAGPGHPRTLLRPENCGSLTRQEEAGTGRPCAWRSSFSNALPHCRKTSRGPSPLFPRRHDPSRRARRQSRCESRRRLVGPLPILSDARGFSHSAPGAKDEPTLNSTGFPRCVERGLGVAGCAVVSRPHAAGICEAGVFEHREEDLPRHGARNSVGPGGFLWRRFFAGEPHVARLDTAARLEHPEDLAEG